MLNITPILPRKSFPQTTAPLRAWPGGVVGIVCWWIAVAVPLMLYGSSTLLFFFWTWPFFLALLPVSVVIGIATRALMHGQLIWTMLVSALLVICLFWLFFMLLISW